MVTTTSREAMQATMEGEPDTASASDLSGSLAILRRRWWLLLLVPLLAAFAAYELIGLRGATYNATATVLVTAGGGPNDNLSNDVTAATMLTQTYSGLVTSPPILQQVIADFKLPDTPTQLASRVTVAAQPSSQIITITAKDRSPQGAANIANAVGDHFVAFLSDLQKTGANQSNQALQDAINKARAARDTVSGQLDALRAAPGTPTPEMTARIANLTALLDQDQNTYSSLLALQTPLSLAQVSAQNGASVVVRAVPPQNPAGSIRLLSTLGALLAGLGLTTIAVILAEQASPRVRSRKDLWRATDLPMLVTVPRTRISEGIEVIEAPRSAMSEAIHALRAQIWQEARGRDATAIVVTNPGPREGASIVAVNLAAAFAQAGQHVVLVDGNLRHPSHWRVCEKDSKHPGLAELAAVPALTPQDVLAGGPRENMQLLLAGPVSVIPTELLTAERFEAITADLRARADVLIIDAPSVLTSADALVYAAAADHVIVVAGVGRTRVSALRTALARIQAMNAHMLGLVLYGAPADGASE